MIIRTLYSVGFLIGCIGLPLQAKGIPPASTQPAPTQPSKCKSTEASSEKSPKKSETASDSKNPAKSALKPETASTTKTPAKSSPPTKTHSDAFARASKPSSRNVDATEGGRLARLTAYWAGEGDYYTGHAISSTGVHLHDGHCAVDPSIIPYGSVVQIAGVGKYLAVDTGSAVISREAAREAAHTSAERNALVIDIYFESRADGERFASSGPKYAAISWTSPSSASSAAKDDRSLFADENWTRIKNKQL